MFHDVQHSSHTVHRLRKALLRAPKCNRFGRTSDCQKIIARSSGRRLSIETGTAVYIVQHPHFRRSRQRLCAGAAQARGPVTLGQFGQQWLEHLDQSTQMLLVVPPGIDGT